jgi:hypothetical protein
MACSRFRALRRRWRRFVPFHGARAPLWNGHQTTHVLKSAPRFHLQRRSAPARGEEDTHAAGAVIAEPTGVGACCLDSATPCRRPRTAPAPAVSDMAVGVLASLRVPGIGATLRRAAKRPSRRHESRASIEADSGLQTALRRVAGGKATQSKRLFRRCQETGIAQECVVGPAGLREARKINGCDSWSFRKGPFGHNGNPKICRTTISTGAHLFVWP